MQLTLKQAERGVALTETVLMMSFIMLMLYALVQTGMSAFYQVSADGASFIGSHVAVVNDPDGTGNGPAVAKSVAASVFEGLGAGAVYLYHPSNTTTEMDMVFQNNGLGFQNGKATVGSREVESSADSQAPIATNFPPTMTADCLPSAINAQTGAVQKMPIYAQGSGGITTVGATAANALPGSLSINTSSISNTFGSNAMVAAEVSAAQTALDNTLQTISADTLALQNAPILGPIVVSQVSGTILPAAGGATSGIMPVGGANTIASLISGENGEVASALQGNLTTIAPLTAILGGGVQTVGGAAGGLISTLNATTGMYAGPAQGLSAALLALGPDLEALDGAEAAAGALDKTVAGTACP